MDGLYLYCLREKTKDSPPILAKGVDGDGEVFVLPYRQLEAVVSKVCLEEFGSDEIPKKAQEDLSWIREKALAHEKVIEQAMRQNSKVLSVIPMRFGTIFKDGASLEKVLDKDYSKVEKNLERIRGKQEWSVKVYLMDREKFEQAVKEKSESIKEKEEEMASLPEGMAFFMEEELKEIIAKEVDKELGDVVTGFFDRLAKHTASSIKNRLLQKELTGRREPMVLNSAYLIQEKEIDDFKAEIEDLKREIQTQGFCLEYSGPWPPYNFI